MSRSQYIAQLFLCAGLLAVSATGAEVITPAGRLQKKKPIPAVAVPSVTPNANYGKYAFTMRSLDGVSVKLADEAGKTVLVAIWSPGCVPCERETDGLVKLFGKYHPAGFDIVGVAVKTTETEVRAFQLKHGVKWTIGIDDGILNSYGMYGMPDHYLFGVDGALLKHYIGMIREDILRQDLEEIFHPKPAPGKPKK